MRVIPKQTQPSGIGHLPQLLQSLHEETRRQLLRGAEKYRFAAGERFDEEGQSAVGLVIVGVARTFVVGPDGRQQTIRYVQAGELLGAERLLGVTTDVCAEAVTPVRWIRLLPGHVAALMRVNPDVALAVARELATDHAAAIDQVWQAAFLSLRGRLAHHLYLRAEADQESLRLTQKQMASMVGSVREVVGRLAKELERAGVFRRLTGGAIEIDVDALRPFLVDRHATDMDEAQVARVS